MLTNPARLRIVLTFAMALVSTIVSGMAVAQPARRLPAVEAYDLAGEARRFPSGLPTEMTLVIAAFDRAQQSIADRLFGQIAKAGAAQQGIAAIETPVIQDPGRVARFFIDNGMKGGIPDPEKRKVVVTLYVKDLEAWLAETGLGSKAVCTSWQSRGQAALSEAHGPRRLPMSRPSTRTNCTCCPSCRPMSAVRR
jgi:hypothetical protein